MNGMAKIAAAYLRQAASRLKDAEEALEEGNHPYSLRLSQECVELSLKTSLRLVGVEYPKIHDVSGILSRVAEKFPEWFRRELERLCETSRILASKREVAFYGSEEEHRTPEEIIGREEAEDALDRAKKVYQLCNRLLLEYRP
ncbi:MAG: HEPN domain-containing protein [Candidatus Bathyarchaeia archaeon]